MVGSDDDNDEQENPENNWSTTTTQIEEELSNIGGKRDKTAVSRTESLERIIKYLKHSYLPDFILSQKSEFLRILKHGLSCDSVQEQILTCTLLSLLSLISGPTWKSFYQQFSSTLIQGTLKSDSFDVRSACLETLCICCFVWTDEESDTDECLKLIQKVILNEEGIQISKENSCYFQSGLDMWCLMMTVMDDNTIVDEFLPNDIESILNLLRCDEINVRLAASEALALLCNTVAITEEEKEEKYTQFFFNGYFDVDAVKEMLQTTDLHQERKINKKDREKQRHGFKDTLSALQEGTSPTVPMIIGARQFSFSDWKSIKRVSTFRNLLDTGFQTHVQYNPLLSSIFDISHNTPKLDKLVPQNSAVAKDRSQQKKAGRYAKMKRSEETDQQ